MKKRFLLVNLLISCIVFSACSPKEETKEVDSKKDEIVQEKQDVENEKEEIDDSNDIEEIDALWSQENSKRVRVTLDSSLVDGKAELIIPPYNSNEDQRIEYVIDGEKICDFSFTFPEQITEIEACDYNFDGIIDIIFVGYNSEQKDFWLNSGDAPDYEGDTFGFRDDTDYKASIEKELTSDYSAEDIKEVLTNGIYNGDISSYKDAYKAVIAFNQTYNDWLDLKYSLLYIDEDDIPELVADNTGYGLSVYSFSNNTVTEPMAYYPYGTGGCVYYEYAPYKNCIRYFGHDMETYGDSLMAIENNVVVSTYSEECYYEEDTINYYNYTDENLSPEETKNRFEEYNSYSFEDLAGEYTDIEILDQLQ